MKKLIVLLALAIINHPALATAQGQPQSGLGSGISRDYSQITRMLSKDEYGRVLRRKSTRDRLKKCYRKELKRTPGLTGKISIYFTISSTGTVSEAVVRESSFGNERVENCSLGVIRSLRFAKPKGGGIVVVTYPIFFSEKK